MLEYDMIYFNIDIRNALCSLQSCLILARIYRGREAKEGERPFNLILRTDFHLPSARFHGATLIHKTWALTASHCVTIPPSKKLVQTILVAGGSINRNSPKLQEQVFDVKDNVFVHPSWDWEITSGYGI